MTTPQSPPNRQVTFTDVVGSSRISEGSGIDGHVIGGLSRVATVRAALQRRGPYDGVLVVGDPLFSLAIASTYSYVDMVVIDASANLKTGSPRAHGRADKSPSSTSALR